MFQKTKFLLYYHCLNYRVGCNDIPTQKAICDSFTGSGRYKIIGVYHDIFMSGDTGISNRPEFQEMLFAIRNIKAHYPRKPLIVTVSDANVLGGDDCLEEAKAVIAKAGAKLVIVSEVRPVFWTVCRDKLRSDLNLYP